jgi:hypothetical protein
MQNRKPTMPGRVEIIPENGDDPFFAIMKRADAPEQEGTEWNKGNVLSDSTAMQLLLRIEDDPVPNDAFKAVAPAIHLSKRTFRCADLTPLYESEVYQSQYSTIWDWINARIAAEDWHGLDIGDYIPLVLPGNILFKQQIAGINTYKRYGDVEPGAPAHIDFISKDCHPDAIPMNRVNFNNGTTVNASPYLASELEARLNSKQKSVVTSAAATPAMAAVDYRTTGILDKLPQALRDVIKTKRALLPTRYTAGSLLIDDNSWAWFDLGPLWIPFEMEVYGTNMWGTLLAANPGFSIGGFVQYPIFDCNMERVKGIGDGGARTHWWLGSARGGNSTHFARVTSNGSANNTTASSATVRVPLCFRI